MLVTGVADNNNNTYPGLVLTAQTCPIPLAANAVQTMTANHLCQDPDKNEHSKHKSSNIHTNFDTNNNCINILGCVYCVCPRIDRAYCNTLTTIPVRWSIHKPVSLYTYYLPAWPKSSQTPANIDAFHKVKKMSPANLPTAYATTDIPEEASRRTSSSWPLGLRVRVKVRV